MRNTPNQINFVLYELNKLMDLFIRNQIIEGRSLMKEITDLVLQYRVYAREISELIIRRSAEVCK